MRRHNPEKGIALYTKRESQLWDCVEKTLREKYNANQAREGEVAAQAFAEIVGEKGPLDGGKA
jgi:predicted oxidoreductase (fatty acid repression mutant protein)